MSRPVYVLTPLGLSLTDAEPDPDGARDPGAHAGGRLVLLRPRGHDRRSRRKQRSRNDGRRRGELLGWSIHLVWFTWATVKILVLGDKINCTVSFVCKHF